MKRTMIAVVLAAALARRPGRRCPGRSGAGAINLTFPIGARYNALGEAGTALSQDVTAMWWNPGGLAFLPQRPEQHDIQIMQSSLAAGLADDIGLYWGGYAMPMGKHGSLGFAINYLDMGDAAGHRRERRRHRRPSAPTCSPSAPPTACRSAAPWASAWA